MAPNERGREKGVQDKSLIKTVSRPLNTIRGHLHDVRSKGGGGFAQKQTIVLIGCMIMTVTRLRKILWISYVNGHRERMSRAQNKPRLSPLMKIEAGREEEMCQPRPRP